MEEYSSGHHHLLHLIVLSQFIVLWLDFYFIDVSLVGVIVYGNQDNKTMISGWLLHFHLISHFLRVRHFVQEQ